MRRLRLAPLPPPGHRALLDAEPSHHLLHVLRARLGLELLVFDGQGAQARARLVGQEEGRALVELLTEPALAAPTHPLHLLLGLLKGSAMDAAVRMATEAGVTHVHPLLLERSVARGDRTQRWLRIATSAATQCGRADIPQFLTLARLGQALVALPPGVDARVALLGAERLPAAQGPAAVLVGPEGGLTPKEAQQALDAGLRPMGLGSWVLRAETAAAVATAITAS